MKQLSCTIGLFLILFFASFSQEKKELKVMSYNILTGFDWAQDSTRGLEAVKWINQQNPDVLALQEMNGFTQESLEEFARKWHHSYAVLLKETGYPVALTSKQPIEIIEKMIDGMWHGMLHVQTFDIDFFVIHLSPADWKFRKKEADLITPHITQSLDQLENVIVLGDFNAHSPMDADFNQKYPYQLERYRKGDAGSTNYKNLRDGEYDYSVISSFLAIGLTDICQKFVPMDDRSTCPTPLNVPQWLSAEEMVKTKHRIDFILANPELAKNAIGAFIHNSKENDYLSDHYPVTTIFKLK